MRKLGLGIITAALLAVSAQAQDTDTATTYETFDLGATTFDEAALPTSPDLSSIVREQNDRREADAEARSRQEAREQRARSSESRSAQNQDWSPDAGMSENCTRYGSEVRCEGTAIYGDEDSAAAARLRERFESE